MNSEEFKAEIAKARAGAPAPTQHLHWLRGFAERVRNHEKPSPHSDGSCLELVAHHLNHVEDLLHMALRDYEANPGSHSVVWHRAVREAFGDAIRPEPDPLLALEDLTSELLHPRLPLPTRVDQVRKLLRLRRGQRPEAR